MIKNIVFDFGNVIVKFNKEEILSKFTNNKDEQQFLIDNVINSPEWLLYGLLDTGMINIEEAITLINDRTNHQYDTLVEEFMLNYRYHLKENGDIINLIKKLKNNGYKLYLLSNICKEVHEAHKDIINELFDGTILSYKINMIKPYKSIFKYALDKYNLDPSETLFIDDRSDNVETANSLGIKGRNVNENDYLDILKLLEEYNIKYD